MKKKHKNKSHIFQILTALILSFVCAFGCIGCVGFIGDYSYAGNAGENGNRPGDGLLPGGGGGEYEDNANPYDSASFQTSADVFLGAVVEYDAGAQSKYYDPYLDKLVTYEYLANRQFAIMQTYISAVLTSFYGLTNPDYYITESSTVALQWQGSEDLTTSYADMIPYYQLLDNQIYWDIISGKEKGLNFHNTIAGGYAYEITLSASGGGTDLEDLILEKGYNTSRVLTENAWKGAYLFNYYDFWRRAIRWVYNNPSRYSNLNHIDVNENPEELDLGADPERAAYYAQVELADAKSTAVPSKLGVDREFMWDLAYFIAYSVIGKDNIEADINSEQAVFSGGGVRELKNSDFENVAEEEWETAFSRHKGYSRIIPEIINSLFNLCYCHDDEDDSYYWVWGYFGDIEKGDVFTSDDIWYDTAFPNLNKSQYIFYDDINAIGWGGAGWEDKRWEVGEDGVHRAVEDLYYLDKPANLKCQRDDVPDGGACFDPTMTIKSIYLIPRIKESYKSTVDSKYAKYFWFGGVMFGMKLEEMKRENGNYYDAQNPNRDNGVKINYKYLDYGMDYGRGYFSLAEAPVHTVDLYGFFATSQNQASNDYMPYHAGQESDLNFTFNYSLIEGHYNRATPHFASAKTSVYDNSGKDVSIDDLIEESFDFKFREWQDNNGKWQSSNNHWNGHELHYEYVGYDYDYDEEDYKEISYLSARNRLFANKGEISIYHSVLKFEFQYAHRAGEQSGQDSRPWYEVESPKNTMMFFTIY